MKAAYSIVCPACDELGSTASVRCLECGGRLLPSCGEVIARYPAGSIRKCALPDGHEGKHSGYTLLGPSASDLRRRALGLG